MLFVLGFLILFFVLWLVFLVAEPALANVLKRTAHWTTSFRYRDYLPVLIVLAVGLAAAMAAGDAFEDLAVQVHANSTTLHDIDTNVHEWARYTRTPGSTRFFTTMTLIGTPLPLGIFVAVIVVFLIAKRHWRWAVYLAFTTAVGALLNIELKAYFHRTRPDLAEALRHASGFSFPSGHAMGATVVFGSLAYLAVRAFARWQWRWRAAVLAFALSMIIAIASSRIYLGVHWISDVGAGMAAGLVWVTTSTVAYETFRRIRLVRALRDARDDAPTLTS